MFTWSLGWAPSPARLAMTSLAFMFDEVPEPVWKTSIGNWSSCLPSAISSAAAAMRFGELGVEQAELGVRARGGALDAAEPAHDVDRDALAGHGEVVDGLGGLAAPELLRGVLHGHRVSLDLGFSGPDAGARPGLGGDLARVQRLAAVAADHRRLRVVAALLVEQEQRRPGVAGEVLVAPAHDRDDGRIQVAAHRGQLVLVALGLLLIEDALEDPGARQRLQARREDVARDAEVALQLGEAADAEEGLAHDQERPALAEDLHRAADRTWLVLHHVTVSRWRSRSSTVTTTCCSRSARSPSPPTTGTSTSRALARAGSRAASSRSSRRTPTAHDAKRGPDVQPEPPVPMRTRSRPRCADAQAARPRGGPGRCGSCDRTRTSTSTARSSPSCTSRAPRPSTRASSCCPRCTRSGCARSGSRGAARTRSATACRSRSPRRPTPGRG